MNFEMLFMEFISYLNTLSLTHYREQTVLEEDSPT